MPTPQATVSSLPRLAEFGVQPGHVEQDTGGFLDRMGTVGGGVVGFAQHGLQRAGEAFDAVTDAVRDVSFPKPSRTLTARLAAGALAFGGGMAAEMVEAAPASGAKARVTRVANQPPVHDAAYSDAMQQYQNDPLRTTPWAGDTYKEGDPKPNLQAYSPMFYDCSPGTMDAPPFPMVYLLDGKTHFKPTFSYNRQSGALRLRFFSGPPQYCDLMGKTTERFTAYRVGSHTSRQIGRTVIYEDGVREALSRYLPSWRSTSFWPSGAARRFFQKTVTIPGVGNLCRPGANTTGGTVVRIKDERSFKGDPNETFQHLSQAGAERPAGKVIQTPNGPVFNGRYSWVTLDKNVCTGRMVRPPR